MSTPTLFQDLELTEEVLSALTEQGFVNATPVQAESIPLIRTGADILARSQTGTGKTIAFGIPAVESIDAEIKSVQVLILSPTRELAQQCGDEIRKLCRNMPWVKTADLYGGSDYDRQFRALRTANLVIGTPGRVMDHMDRGSLKLQNLKMIVLDEADEMLNMGFKEDIERILMDVPEERQIVLFSATVPAGIAAITKQFLRDPVNVDINRDQMTLKSIQQQYVDVPMHQKPEVLKLLMHRYRPTRAIIFANTKTMVDELTELLSANGLSVEGLHGDMKQLQRTTVMNGFKKGRVNILVATDVAARGIDVSDIDYVINFDIPKVSEYYVHRIGRTGRAGREGTAITLCCGKRQIIQMQQMARITKSTISPLAIPTISDIDKSNWLRDLEVIRTRLSEDLPAVHEEMIQNLVSEGHSAVDIATALLGLTFHHDTSSLKDVRPVKTVAQYREEGQKAGLGKPNAGKRRFGDMVLSMGSANRVAPNHIVGAVTERTGISARDIGKIDIATEHTVVGVPADLLDDIILAMQGCKICGKPVTAAALEEPRRVRSDRFGGGNKKPYGARKFGDKKKSFDGKKPYGEKKSFGDKKKSYEGKKFSGDPVRKKRKKED